MCKTLLKQQLQGQLQLPRIKHRPWSSEQRIRRWRSGSGATANLTLLDRHACRILVFRRDLSAAEIVRSVDADDLVHIRVIEQVENVERSFKPQTLSRKMDRALDANIPRLEAVSLVGVSRKIPNAIRGRDEVVVGIEADKQRKWSRTLKSDDVAQQEIS